MTNRPTHAVVDLDFQKYAAASTAEKRTIIVTHKASGSQMSFNNRTEFWGRGKTLGGWLGEKNAKRTSPFEKSEFDIEDVQTAEPVAHALYTAKRMVENCIEASGAKTAEYHIGEGDCFRLERSTLLKYKDREDLIKPLLLDEVKEYLIKKFKATVHTHLEVDDVTVIQTYKKPNAFAIVSDKDAYSQPCRVFNPTKPELGIIDCDCFGKLYLNEKKEVKGYGRIHLYYQMSFGDPTDTIKASCFSDVKWGSMSAFKSLEFCETDKQALQAVVDAYKLMYPEPKKVIGWRGDEITIDHNYVMDEVFDLVRMLRWKGDHLKLHDVLNKVGVTYE